MDIEELVTSYMKKDIGQLELIQSLKTTTSILSTKRGK